MTHYLNLLTRAMSRGWKNEALCDLNGDGFTFGEVAEQIEKLRIIFKGCGLQKGDRIAICADESARRTIAFLAINTCGAAVVPVQAEEKAEEICKAVDQSGSKVLFTYREIWENMNPRRMQRLRAVIDIRNFGLLWSRDADAADAVQYAGKIFLKKYPYDFSIENVYYETDNDKDIAFIGYLPNPSGMPRWLTFKFEDLSKILSRNRFSDFFTDFKEFSIYLQRLKTA